MSALTFDDLPIELTALLERDSWVRVAASAYRRDTSGDACSCVDLALAEMIDYLQQSVAGLFSHRAAPGPSVSVWHPQRPLSYFSIDVTFDAGTDK
ncbi:MAG: hypothetical protein RXR20_26635 [Paraburkholderia sp.]|uniref:hypothetical protein n=1 Tax=Burkholderiaceae TaxID=119060 RepID=UPI0010F76032|nr:hypothetical protein [Burkholderia sp. 4M9327F10]